MVMVSETDPIDLKSDITAANQETFKERIGVGAGGAPPALFYFGVLQGDRLERQVLLDTDHNAYFRFQQTPNETHIGGDASDITWIAPVDVSTDRDPDATDYSVHEGTFFRIAAGTWNCRFRFNTRALRQLDIFAKFLEVNNFQDFTISQGNWVGGSIAHNGIVYVIDQSNNIAEAFDALTGAEVTGSNIDLGTSQWAGGFRIPNRFVFVTDGDNGARFYNDAGQIQTSETLNLPSGLWRGGIRIGDRMYFFRANSTSDHLRAYDLSRNRQASDDKSLGDTAFDADSFITATPNYIVVLNNPNIRIYDHDGNFIEELAGTSTIYDDGICYDALTDRIFVTNSGQNILQVFDGHFKRLVRDKQVGISSGTYASSVTPDDESQLDIQVDYLVTDGTEEFYIFLEGLSGDIDRFVGGYAQFERLV